MTHQAPARGVAAFRPKPAQILEMVHSAAKTSANVKFGTHALDRMEERGITTLDALRVLQTGDLKGDIEPGNQRGEWKCKIVKKMKGSREAGVVTIVMSSRRLFVKTVEWEDR